MASIEVSLRCSSATRLGAARPHRPPPKMCDPNIPKPRPFFGAESRFGNQGLYFPRPTSIQSHICKILFKCRARRIVHALFYQKWPVTTELSWFVFSCMKLEHLKHELNKKSIILKLLLTKYSFLSPASKPVRKYPTILHVVFLEHRSVAWHWRR